MSGWIKSSLSAGTGECVQVRYVKSSASQGAGECVEAGLCSCGDVDQVWVRDSKLGEASPVLRVTVAEWAAFLEAVRTARLDAYSGALHLMLRTDLGCDLVHRDNPDGGRLSFTLAEWTAFVGGVHAGEFETAVLARDPKPAARASEPSLADPGAEKASV